jgi:hypothetical protein
MSVRRILLFRSLARARESGRLRKVGRSAGQGDRLRQGHAAGDLITAVAKDWDNPHYLTLPRGDHDLPSDPKQMGA